MHFVSIISLLAIAGGVAQAGGVPKECVVCHTNAKSSLVLESQCALKDGGVQCQ